MIKSQRLRDLAEQARSRLRALRDLTARGIRRVRATGDVAAAQTLPRLRALRYLAARAILRLRALSALAVAQIRPRLRALRDLATRAILLLRALWRLAANGIRRLRALSALAAAQALPRLRALRNLAARAILLLRPLSNFFAQALVLLRGSAPAAAVVLAAIVTSTFLMFVLTEPAQRWLLLLGVVAAAFGTDGVLRSSHPRAFALGLDTTPHLVLPTLYALAIPLFIEQNMRGFWTPLSALLAGLGFAVIVIAEVRSVREFERLAGEARVVADAGAYLVAFAMLSLVYSRDPGLVAAVAAAALVGGLLSIELLRNSSLRLLDMLTLALVGALVLGEMRWALDFVPLDGHLAAIALLLAFFFTSGLLAARLRGHLTREVVVQYGAITAVGVAAVVAARAADLA